MFRPCKLPAILSICLLVLKISGFAAAALTHTITSVTDIAVTSSGYTADGALDLTLGFTPTPGMNLTVVRNTGPAFIAGTFTNVPQGATVPLVRNGITYNYIANYYGENGRSLVLHWPLIRLAEWGPNAEVDTTGVLAGKTVIAAATGEDHSLALTSDGLVFAWGSNYYGQLGKTGIASSNVPVAVDTSGALAGKTVVAIKAGIGMSLALTSEGQVFGWGFNGDGRLGNNSTTNSPVPVAVDTSGVLAGKTVTAISCGLHHCLALSFEGKVVGWGNNYEGQLGNNSTTHSPIPVDVVTSGVLSGKTVVAISGGAYHSVAATSDGLAYAWGANNLGQLGNNSTSPSPVPVTVTSTGVLAGKSVVSLAAGYSQTLALTSNGQVVAWGPNGSSGLLGNHSTSNSLVPVNTVGSLVGRTVVSIAAGHTHGLALTSDGQTHVWGSNGYRQLGNDSDIDTPVLSPVAMPGLGPLAGKTVAAIAAGTYHNLAMIDAGPPVLSLNPVGKMANSGTSVSFTAVAKHPFPTTVQWQESAAGVSGPFNNIDGNSTAQTGTLILPAVSPSQNGHAYRAVFSNLSGSSTTTSAILTITNWATTFTSGTQIPFQADSVVVSGTLSVQLGFTPTPGTHLTVIRNNGPAFISGEFSNVPQAGVVPLTYNGITYQYIANYYGENGRSLVLQWPCTGLAAWGRGNDGELGNGATTTQNTTPLPVTTRGVMAGKTIVAMAAGTHSLALASDGNIYGWGANLYGQLGNNSTTTSSVPVAVSMDGSLAGKNIVAVAAGSSHSLALTADGQVYSWGLNNYGQLGNGTTISSSIPVAVSSSGALAGKTVVAIAAGTFHNLALTSDGQIFSWGFNSSGQLGNNTFYFNSTVPVAVNKEGVLRAKTVIAIAAGYDHSMALTLDGAIFSWGSNTSGKLGNSGPSTENKTQPVAVVMNGALAGKTVTAITAGTSHNLALTSDGRVFAWGYNSDGQLGIGSTVNSFVPAAVNTTGALAGRTLAGIAAGNYHSLARTTDGLVFAWGHNGDGELGNNALVDSLLPVAVDTSRVLAGKKVTDLAGGISHNLVLFDSGAPAVTRQPLDQMAAGGESVTFSVEGADHYPFTVKWQESATGVAGPFSDLVGNPTATTNNLVLANIIPAQSGSAYRAVFTNAAGITATTAANLTVVAWSATFSSATDVPFQSDGVTVSGSLSLQLGFAPAAGTHLTVIKNTGPAFINGAFDNVPQGGRVTLDYNGVSYDFIANYFGGNGRSLVLQWPWMKLAAWGSGVTTPTLVDTSGALAGKALFGACAGGGHTLAVTSEGRVFAWDSTTQTPTPVDTSGVLAGKTVIASAAGGSHSLVLTTEGQVFSWGSNFSRQLGNNSSANSTLPVTVDTSGVLAGKTVVAIAAGDDHSLVLDSGGRVFSWGSNSNNQLGNGGWQNSPIPVAVETSGALIGKTVVAIAAGENHSMALSSDGQVFTWGSNSSGQLGNNGTTDSSVPVKVDTTGALAGKTVVAIAAGARHCMALTSDGRVFTWGYDWYGQLGDTGSSDSPVPVPTDLSGPLAGQSVTSMAAGEFHSLVLTAGGQVIAWGYNSSGQLGNGTTISSPVPVSVNSNGVLAGGIPMALSAGTSHSLTLFGAEGSPVVTANPVSRTVIQGNPPANLPVSFSAAGMDIFPLSIQWQVSPTGIAGPFSDITGNPSAATGTLVLPAVTVAEQGYAYRAVLSNNGGMSTTTAATVTVITSSNPLNFATGTEIPFSAGNPMVSGSLDITLGFAPIPGTDLTIIKNTGSAFISGEFSNLHQGATIPLTHGGVTHSYVVNYFAGNGRSLMLQWALTKVASWGAGASGQLGNNSTTTSKLPVLVNATGVLAGKNPSAMAAGSNHGLAITPSGEVFAWGANASGQLGDNSTTNRTVPVTVDATGELAGKSVVAVAAGDLHSLALTSDGRVFGWGSNGAGRLGNASTTNSSVPVAVSTSGVLSGRTVSAIAAGSAHSLALGSDGRVFAWGFNTSGQLGNRSTASSSSPVEVFSGGVLADKTVISIAAGTSHSLALTSDGRVYAWGSNQSGQLGVYSPTNSSAPIAVNGNGLIAGKTVIAIAAGASHSVALTSDGKVYAWGFGYYGQLGNGSTSVTYIPQAVVTSGVLSGKSVVSIAAGASHSLAVTSEGKAYAWGSNASGQIGDNSFNSTVSSPVAVFTTSGAVATRKVLGMSGGNTHSLALVAGGVAASVTAHPANRTIPATGNVTFSATSDGGYPTAMVRWQQSPAGAGGTFSNITGNATATTGTLELTNVAASRNGYAYRAVFTNSEASVNSTPATLTVVPPPTLSVPANIAQDATGTTGSVVEFSVTASDTLDGPLTPTISPPSGTVFPIGTTTVNCSVTNSLGLTSTASFTITVRKSYAWFIDLHDLTDSDPGADPNHTGVDNLTAYAFGLDPAAPDRAQLPSVQLANGHLQISYTRWKTVTDVSYVVEVSDDLSAWNSGAGHSQQVTVTSIDAGRERVVEQDLTPVSAATHRFMRIRIVK